MKWVQLHFYLLVIYFAFFFFFPFFRLYYYYYTIFLLAYLHCSHFFVYVKLQRVPGRVASLTTAPSWRSCSLGLRVWS